MAQMESETEAGRKAKVALGLAPATITSMQPGENIV